MDMSRAAKPVRREPDPPHTRNALLPTGSGAIPEPGTAPAPLDANVLNAKKHCGENVRGDEMELLQHYWVNLTEAQASLVSTAVLIVAGGLGVLFGAALFGGRVKNLKSALEASNEVIQKHQQEAKAQLEAMEEQMSATLGAVSQLRSSVFDLRSDVEEKVTDAAGQRRQTFKNHWYAIRDELQRRASDPRIHGKTRTRYAGYSNSQISALLQAMETDGNLYSREAKAYRDAQDLWTWHRNGRPNMNEGDVQKMRELAIELVPDYRPD
ncbi:DUF948 domain-containing protein [Henriciella marina]|uniref:DUF948 domain-containing protein n=1 Tax=Henriciella marina TaxID=453851 RepID=UPI000374E4DF|nr:DUF948 domain-containing protein [Henriciella marina]